MAMHILCIFVGKKLRGCGRPRKTCKNHKKHFLGWVNKPLWGCGWKQETRKMPQVHFFVGEMPLRGRGQPRKTRKIQKG